MRHYLLVPVTHVLVEEDGTRRAVTTNYLQDATSLTEAEARLTQALAPELLDMQIVKGAKPFPASEIIRFVPATKDTPNNTVWHQAKIAYVPAIDESAPGKGRKPKEITQVALIEGDDVAAALAALNKHLETWLVKPRVLSIGISNIADVFDYVAPEPATTSATSDGNKVGDLPPTLKVLVTAPITSDGNA